MDRRRFALTLLATGLVSGLSACGRRGPLEPPPDTAQGREWQRRVGGGPQQPRQPQQPAGSVRSSLERDDEQKGTVDIEADIERPRGEGLPREPVDPTLNVPGQVGVGQPTPGQTGGGGSGGNSSLTGGRRRPPGIVPPKRDFILDGLLE